MRIYYVLLRTSRTRSYKSLTLHYTKLTVSCVVFSTNKQAEAICDVVTSLDSDSALGEVSERLLGSEIIQYLKDSIPK